MRLFVAYSLRAVPVALLLLTIVWLRHKLSFTNAMLVITAGLICLLTNFPTATPRFWTATVALGMAVHLGLLRRKWVLPGVVMVGILVIFPLLGGARRVTSPGDLLLTLRSNPSIQAFTTNDFDAYSMLSYTNTYTIQGGSTHGAQLFSSTFFFIPRSLWEGKSTGSGSIVAKHIGLEYLNVSSPLPAEGLINFGILGVVGFAIAAAWFAARLDTAYWSGATSWVEACYPFMVSLFFFVMRGDLLSSLSFSIGFLVP
ncbi:MAG TPA: hypothetical protein VFX10_02180, partial [Nitrospira sp.]|nr:hypothetical protein [Nitrospira sp.]